MTLPVVMDTSGAVPTDVSTIRSNLDAAISEMSPGYTSNLEGTLVEDMLSTGTGAVAAIDQARVESINNVSPYACNEYFLSQLGAMKGIARGLTTYTRAYVQFSGTPNFSIPVGFTVSDGVYQYQVQNSVSIGTGGTAATLALVVATTSGSWSVPIGSINQITTSVPTKYTVSVTNPQVGTEGGEEDWDVYRARAILAQRATCQGSLSMIKTMVAAVTGVQARTVNAIQYGSGYLVMAAGGDTSEVANAIYKSVGDLNILQTSVLNVATATQANPCVITTDLTHGLTDSESVTISGAEGMTSINGAFTATVLTPTTFSIAVDTSSSAAYTGGGVIAENGRNQTGTVIDAPDVYTIPFVVPLAQTVRIALVWNTTATGSISDDTIASLGTAAIVSYVNGLSAGEPINRFYLDSLFQTAISSVLTQQLLTRLVWTVTIDGVIVSETTGTGLIQGDTQSYLTLTSSDVSVTRG